MEPIVNVNPTQNQNLFELQLEGLTVGYLRDAAKWARFIAIVGFVMCALMVLIGLFAGSMIAASMSMAFEGASVMGGSLFTIIYVLLAALWFFPCLYLFRFATNMQRALNNNEQDKLITSFQNLKSHYRFIGILIIIMLAFYAIAIIGGIIAAATMGLN